MGTTWVLVVAWLGAAPFGVGALMETPPSSSSQLHCLVHVGVAPAADMVMFSHDMTRPACVTV